MDYREYLYDKRRAEICQREIDRWTGVNHSYALIWWQELQEVQTRLSTQLGHRIGSDAASNPRLTHCA